MKEHVQEPGVRKYAGDDLIELQSEPLKAIQTLFKEYPTCVVQGCEVEALSAETYTVKSGLLSLKGLDAAGVPCHKLVPFEGATGVVLPAYFTLTYDTQTRVYGDGKAKPIAHKYKAVLSVIAPAVGVESLQITSGGAPRWVDVLKITQKLDREGGQAKDVLVNYAQAATRSLPSSGTKLGVLFGLVTKWFADLKALAFKDKVSKGDLDAALATELDNKVLKIEGKGLSTKDYTQIEKDKLAAVDTEKYRKENCVWENPDTTKKGLVMYWGDPCPSPDTYCINTFFGTGVEKIGMAQIAVSIDNTNEMYIRHELTGKWLPWERLAKASDIPTSLPANGGEAETANRLNVLQGNASNICNGYNYGDGSLYINYSGCLKPVSTMIFVNGLSRTDTYINLTARQFVSAIPNGTAPLVVASKTVVTNLNADLLDGIHASDFVKTSDSRLSDARNPLAHSHSNYEPIFSKNTAFNKNFGKPTTLYMGDATAEGSSNLIPRADHVHKLPDHATQSNSGFMSYQDKIKMDSLFTVIAAGTVSYFGQKEGTLTGSFDSSKESLGVYWVTVSNADLVIVNALFGDFTAAVFNKKGNGFNVRTTNGKNTLVDAGFTFAAFKF